MGVYIYEPSGRSSLFFHQLGNSLLFKTPLQFTIAKNYYASQHIQLNKSCDFTTDQISNFAKQEIKI